MLQKRHKVIAFFLTAKLFICFFSSLIAFFMQLTISETNF